MAKASTTTTDVADIAARLPARERMLSQPAAVKRHISARTFRPSRGAVAGAAAIVDDECLAGRLLGAPR
jgi:hypothetical protein